MDLGKESPASGPARQSVFTSIRRGLATAAFGSVIVRTPFFMVAQPWMKGYVYNAEFEVHFDNVWLDRAGTAFVYLVAALLKPEWFG